MKVAVFGLPGTGKTTLAHALATRIGVPVTSLDFVLFTSEGPLPLEAFREEAARVTSGPQWIVEGNYSKLADVVSHRADTLVWLDYSLPVIAWHILRRFARQKAGREANPNNLTFRTTFAGDRSVLGNARRKYRDNRPRYAEQAKETAALGVHVLRFNTPRQARKWLHSASPAGTPLPR